MIVNASPLILYAKIGKPDILHKVLKEVLINEEVYKEIMKGKELGAPDAYLIEDLIKEGKIRVLPLTKKGREYFEKLRKIYRQLDRGEATTIALALQRGEKEILVDESIARAIARIAGLKPRGSLRVLLEAYKQKILDEKELRELINLMIESDLRVSASVIEKFWVLFRKLKK